MSDQKKTTMLGRIACFFGFHDWLFFPSTKVCGRDGCDAYRKLPSPQKTES
ncbi:MAG: hypothetical protein K9M17_05425 [Mariprofundaceae bacterium]|nr:hypothetical protein [Mariprofundaceae bacterium]